MSIPDRENSISKGLEEKIQKLYLAHMTKFIQVVCGVGRLELPN